MVSVLMAALFTLAGWTEVYHYPDFEVDNNDYIYDFPINFPFDAGALKIVFTDAPGSVCGAILDTVEVTQGSSGAQPTTYAIPANGVVELKGSTQVFALKVNQHQDLYSRSYCTIAIAKGDGGGGGNHDGFTLEGAIHYQGGFVSNATLDLPSKPVVTALQISVPTFCKDVEVLEAGTLTEGQYDKAEGTDSVGVFAVNGGAGSRVSGVRIAFNGPVNAPCDVPVYAKIKAD